MVLRYFSWPARSVKVMTLALRLPISSHESFPAPVSRYSKFAARCERLTPRDVRAHNVTRRVKAQNLHAHRAGPPGLNLVLVPEKVDSSFAATVVEVSLNQDP